MHACCIEVKVWADTAKFTDVIVARLRKCSDLIRKGKMFVENKTKVASGVGCSERAFANVLPKTGATCFLLSVQYVQHLHMQASSEFNQHELQRLCDGVWSAHYQKIKIKIKSYWKECNIGCCIRK